MNSKKAVYIVAGLILVAGAFIYFIFSPFKSAPISPKRIAILTASDLQLQGVDGIKAGLKELGHKEGDDILTEIKNPKGDRELTKTMAREIVAAAPDLIVSVSTSASSAVRDANKDAQIPVVAVDVGNFKELGIENIQRPGGFMTAVVVDNVPAAPKRMEILKTLLPNMKKIGILVNDKHVSYDEILRAHEDGAQKLGIEILWFKVAKKEEIAPVMQKLVAAKPDAFMTTSEATISGNAPLIAPALKAAKIPSIDFNIERGVSSGYLMVYGIPRFEVGKQGARIIDKVLNGASPGEIPVEFASVLRLEINAQLARELGISIPENLLLQANKIYQE
ncbi:hypothetical protein A2926_04425 [Candidatus Giovannonibacteria bacterium RIFCSPLOWO2_01_FULL_44_40]|uniref:ABC transporter substrate-binding protein n=1 Tax=Candidatus Giovannonibacteria bacterium RIFCSPHIGHO2_01_FULL_45_23 TaxID=1798325 RepID=A0A1F5VFY0_9BACT|nr:MAG: hypothetical protein A2834_04675 [Candidatus Giovannonibacteria bacterium RIFCSPHIGHO2_01_FULL_45_23]OGF75219.1 MAG: hypothetical protein A3C77_02270 [Candidatus Giovannonibacteria bacterium RIFCSPHIGHO2_02_FULL_45_13]OGF79563.1 MAG: hypothetical protein A2926_04425 [Candidatus Giovannonibacteria bacterium RIFCSPLOWO2_01_FULL_44_40]